MVKLHGLDLFSGIGGISKALESFVKPIAYCENDNYAIATLLSRMQKKELQVAPIWSDVQTLTAKMLPKIDIIYGGFPCQDISVAGRGVGLEGERSGLFFQIVRLAQEIKPTFLFLENVPAIRTRGLDIVIQEFTQIGYDCRWTMLSARDIGANHKRERWFLLAKSNWNNRNSNSMRRCGISWPFKKISNKNSNTNRVCKNVADTARSGRNERHTNAGGRETRKTATKKWIRSPNDSGWATEPNVGRVANGVPNRVDKLKCLGNAVVPLQAKTAFEILMGIKAC